MYVFFMCVVPRKWDDPKIFIFLFLQILELSEILPQNVCRVKFLHRPTP